MTEYTIDTATADDFVEIWPQLRPVDREECGIFGYNSGADFAPLTSMCTDCLIARHNNGDPIAVFGRYNHRNMQVYWFLATPKINEYWRLVTRMGKAYINNTITDQLCARPVAFVWEGHKDSIRWAGLLGFRHRIGQLPGRGGRILILEKRR